METVHFDGLSPLAHPVHMQQRGISQRALFYPCWTMAAKRTGTTAAGGRVLGQDGPQAAGRDTGGRTPTGSSPVSGGSMPWWVVMAGL